MPVLLRRLVKLADFLAAERQHSCFGKEVAIELEHLGADRGGEVAVVHGFPEVGQQRDEFARVLAAVIEQVAKGILRQQLHAGGEHREQAAHQKLRDFFRRVFLRLQGLRYFGEPARDLARRLGGGAGRIERLRIEPDRLEAVAHFRLAQIFKIDAKALAIGKLRVVLSLAGEVGIDLDAVTDIAD